ncbi:hypothetical protein LMG7141_00942 [Ralstonia condita]|uniref:Carboxypeptidase regulatory-like domain-containing protein n=2 Tax=Ralstonia condita TaxID=3058600 RepID=A0ABM9J234_9RALS|nr:hypothetical protein [Burkholderiaceae bacterium]CAJ0779873.1 hypothetical protein LMG7141_00942 [Ralstonia sp. LMG 7141]
MLRIRHPLHAALVAVSLASMGAALAQAPSPLPSTPPDQQRDATADFCTQLRNARTPAERRALMQRMHDIPGANAPGRLNQRPREMPRGTMMDRRSWRAMHEMGCLDEGPRTGTPVARKQGSVAYVSGGIGQDDVEAMRKIAPQYNVRLTFTGKSGEYLSDVDTHIRSADGAVALAVVSEGPLLYVRLPRGSYRVSASYNGVVQQTAMTVPASQAVVRTMTWQHE